MVINAILEKEETLMKNEEHKWEDEKDKFRVNYLKLDIGTFNERIVATILSDKTADVNGQVRFGVAILSYKDQHHRAVGRQIALNRLYNCSVLSKYSPIISNTDFIHQIHRTVPAENKKIDGVALWGIVKGEDLKTFVGEFKNGNYFAAFSALNLVDNEDKDESLES